MNRKFKYTALALIFLICTVTWGLLSKPNAETDIQETEIAALKKEKINSADFPWSIFPGKITEVKSYREAFDADSKNWIAEFSLKPEEAKRLKGWLFPVPSTGLQYGCATAGADWLEETDLCDAGKMQAKRFRGYLYHPFHCDGGCDRTVVLWVNETTGQSYIIGAPRG
jgi:hypothetical protein